MKAPLASLNILPFIYSYFKVSNCSVDTIDSEFDPVLVKDMLLSILVGMEIFRISTSTLDLRQRLGSNDNTGLHLLSVFIVE